MAKEQDRASNPYTQLKASIDALSTLLREVLPALKTISDKAKTTAVAGGAAAPGSGSPQADETHRRNFWQRVTGIDDPDKARSSGIRSALAGIGAIAAPIAGAAIAAGNDPTLTKQERGIAIERSAIQSGIGAAGYALGALGGPIGSLILGQIASSVGGALAGTHRKGEEGIIGEARAGFADLRELAKAGYKFDDDFLKRRAKFETEAAARGESFDKQIAPYLGAAYDQLPQVQAAQAAALEENNRQLRRLNDNLSGFSSIGSGGFG